MICKHSIWFYSCHEMISYTDPHSQLEVFYVRSPKPLRLKANINLLKHLFILHLYLDSVIHSGLPIRARHFSAIFHVASERYLYFRQHKGSKKKRFFATPSVFCWCMCTIPYAFILTHIEIWYMCLIFYRHLDNLAVGAAPLLPGRMVLETYPVPEVLLRQRSNRRRRRSDRTEYAFGLRGRTTFVWPSHPTRSSVESALSGRIARLDTTSRLCAGTWTPNWGGGEWGPQLRSRGSSSIFAVLCSGRNPAVSRWTA